MYECVKNQNTSTLKFYLYRGPIFIKCNTVGEQVNYNRYKLKGNTSVLTLNYETLIWVGSNIQFYQFRVLYQYSS